MIRFRKISLLICCICIAVLAVVIFGGWLANSNNSLTLAQALGMFSEENFEETMRAVVAVGRLLLTAEYFLLGLFVCWLVAMLYKEALEVFLVSTSCGLTYACVCQTLYMILPNRSGSLSNVLIGAVGAALGAGTLVLIFRFCLKSNRESTHRPKHIAKQTNSKRREMPKFEHID